MHSENTFAVRAPARFDPAGGGTDCPPYCLDHEGAVLNFGVGLYARARVGRDRVLLWSGWLTSLAGISLALLAQDLGSFYAGYAVLGLASWLLIIHARKPEAWRAGRVYLVTAIVAGVGFLYFAARALRSEAGLASARKAFLYSLVYLPVVLAALVLNAV